MRYKLLGRSGLRVSEYALGTMTFGEDWGWGASKEESRKIFDRFIERGGNFVDTAVNYTDGTSSTATITSSDWAQGPGATETSAGTLPYRNSVSGSSQQLTVYVYATTVPVDPNKTVKSITFPNVSNTVDGGATAMHIWAVSLGTT